jgi:hypothetical protein
MGVRRPKRLEDLQPDRHNLNRGTKRGADMIARSIDQFGFGRSILVDRNGVIIAGNHVFDDAIERGVPIEVVQTSGDKLVVVQRSDLDMDDAKARGLALADNRASEVGLEWDAEGLAAAAAEGVTVGAFFYADELDRLTKSAADFVGAAPPELPKTTIGEELANANRAGSPPADPSPAPAAAAASPPASGREFAVVFDNDDQHTRWFAFLKYLRGRFEAQPTTGARIDAFLRELEASNPVFAATE